MEFKQYDVVRVKAFHVPISASKFDLKAPAVGDVACIIEIYSNPFGYELECSDIAGITQWMTSFSPHDIDLELIAR